MGRVWVATKIGGCYGHSAGKECQDSDFAQYRFLANTYHGKAQLSNLSLSPKVSDVHVCMCVCECVCVCVRERERERQRERTILDSLA